MKIIKICIEKCDTREHLKHNLSLSATFLSKLTYNLNCIYIYIYIYIFYFKIIFNESKLEPLKIGSYKQFEHVILHVIW